MDEELNRAIDSALAELRSVTPPADFLPRLRAHVEQLPARAPIRWWIPFAASASAVAAGVIVAALARTPRADLAVPRPASSAPATPGVAAAAAVAPAAAVDRPVRAAKVRTRQAPTPAVNDEHVLVPPGQLAAVARFVDAINAGDDHAAATVRRLELGDREIVIQPIQIEPVAVPPLKESM